MALFSEWIRHHRIILIAVLLGLICIFIAFGRSITQGFSPIDDSYLIYNNLLIRGITWEHLKGIFTTFDPELYIPFTFLSFQFNYMLSGLDPALYHITNILIHALNALLVGWIVKKMTKDDVIAVISGLIFAIHPLNSEAVLWLAGRKDLLSTFFFLLSFLFYIRYREHRWKSYIVSILFFACALFSKVSVATFPLVLLCYDPLIEQRKMNAKWILDKIPYVFLSGIFLIVAAIGKQRVLASSTFWQTALMAAKSTTFYLLKFIFPIGLTPLHPFEGTITLFSADFFMPVIVVVLLIAIGIYFLRKTPWITFAILFFLITLAPSFFNFHKGEAMFFAVERYTYIPMIGLLLLITIPLSMVRDALVQSKEGKIIGSIIAIVLIGTFTLTGNMQSKQWNNIDVLFERALALNPHSRLQHVELARIRRKEGKYQEAFQILKDALNDGDDFSLHLEAGYLYEETRNIADAKDQFQKASQMNEKNPEPIYAVGSLDEQLDDTVSALPLYEKAVQLDPSYVIARVALARLYLQNKKEADAESQLNEALKWNDNSFDAHLAMGKLLIDQKKFEEAKIHLEKAHALDAANEEVNRLLSEIQSN